MLPIPPSCFNGILFPVIYAGSSFIHGQFVGILGFVLLFLFEPWKCYVSRGVKVAMGCGLLFGLRCYCTVDRDCSSKSSRGLNLIIIYVLILCIYNITTVFPKGVGRNVMFRCHF